MQRLIVVSQAAHAAHIRSAQDDFDKRSPQLVIPEALELAWESTRGQPWLVNALAEQAVWKTKANLDRTVAIDLQRMRDARETLILRNDTHLDLALTL